MARKNIFDNLMRTDDDATAAAAYLSGQADLIATNSLVVQELMKQNMMQGQQLMQKAQGGG